MIPGIDHRALVTPEARAAHVRVAAEEIARALYVPTADTPARAAWSVLLRPQAMPPRRLGIAAREIRRVPGIASCDRAQLALLHLADACDAAASTSATAHMQCAHSLRLARVALAAWREAGK